jgi:hypothetical protein
VEHRDYPTPCLISTLVSGKDGYVRQTVGGRKVLAHRVAYEQVHGKIEEGLEIDHLCGQRNCLRIDHLEAVSPEENLRRCGKCKLTRADVIDIRRSEEPQSVLAERYGVTQGHISRIQAGLVWRDVVDPEMSSDADSPCRLSLDSGSAEPHDQAQPDPGILKLAA